MQGRRILFEKKKQICGTLLRKKNVQSHKLLADMPSLEEEKLKDYILSEGDTGDEEKMFPEEFCDSDNVSDIKLKKRREF